MSASHASEDRVYERKPCRIGRRRIKDNIFKALILGARAMASFILDVFGHPWTIILLQAIPLVFWRCQRNPIAHKHRLFGQIIEIKILVYSYAMVVPTIDSRTHIKQYLNCFHLFTHA